MRRALLFAFAAVLASIPLVSQQPAEIPLPTSKSISSAAPGAPQRLNTFPNEIAVSPDGQYIAVLNSGYGSEQSQYRQSIAVLNVATNEVTDFADPRFGQDAPQTYFAGLSFSLDGKRLYASVASLTDPEGKKAGAMGNGIAVYSVNQGKLAEDRFIKLPNVELSAGQKFVYGAEHIASNFANVYPAGLAAFQWAGAERLLVASNLSDSVLMVDPATGTVLSGYDLRRKKGVVPARFPYRIVVAKDGRTAWCSLWNDSSVVELKLRDENGGRQQHPPHYRFDAHRRIMLDSNRDGNRTGSHPNALALTPDGRYLFVALSTRDAVSIVNTKTGKRIGEIATKLPGQQYAGAYPDALAFSADGKSLFVADASADAVIKFDVPADLSTTALPTVSAYIPTEWYPTAVAVVGGDLFIASGKGKGSGPNSAELSGGLAHREHPYIASLTRGSLARIPLATIATHAKEFKQQVLEENRMNGRTGEFTFASGKNPIKHVVYIIKENRTYDQILGDLGVGDGDPSLTMFGADVTPNQHALARQFGVLDNFYDSGEVSGDGHVWSTAAITTEYNELVWPINYRGNERTYDFEGKVGDIYPVDHDEDDINEPGTGYLWTNAAQHHLSYRHYGEYVDSEWCETHAQNSPASTGTSTASGAKCAQPQIRPGEPLPSTLGNPKGAPSPYGWPIPVLLRNHATKRELRGHFDPNFADFKIDYPDQLRADEFLNEFSQYVKARQSGKGELLPRFVLLRLPDDHTAGTSVGMPTPQASVADNDLAVGRVVDAISHSPYWDDTAIFILEDDAQDGADHIDAHRSIALVISKYSPREPQPFVDHHFYTTVNVIHTMEALLGLPPMNNNDRQAALMSALFTGDGSQPAYTANYRNRDNRLIYQANQPGAYGATESAAMDFSKEDRINPQVLNRILWRVTKGDIPMPDPKHTVPLR
jgi:DNA-binding beta-propeller fold protein YncE